MASIRGILNIQSLNELTSEKYSSDRRGVSAQWTPFNSQTGVGLGPYKHEK